MCQQIVNRGTFLSTIQITMMNETDGWIRAIHHIPRDDHNKQIHPEAEINVKDTHLTDEDNKAVSVFIETFQSFINDTHRLEHIRHCKYDLHVNVLKNEEFVFTLIKEINTKKHKPEYIANIIEFICYRNYGYQFDERVRDYFKQQDYGILIDLLYVGATQCNNLFKSTTKLISEFTMSNSVIIQDAIIKYLQQCTTNDIVKCACINIMGEFKYGDRQTWLVKELCNIIKLDGSKNDILPLTTKEAILLLVEVLGEEDFEKFFDVFSASNYKKMLAECFIDNKTLDDEFGLLSFRKPKIQHCFFAFRDSVYELNDDELTANMLSYCLFFRTQDIFTVDEVLEEAILHSEDIFYIFIQNFDDFLFDYKDFYVKVLMSNIPKKKVLQIIKRRRHPREKKPIQIINDKYKWLEKIDG